MRDDMYKVIVERPRRGSRMRTRDGRLYRAQEELPRKIGMKEGYNSRKWLNENLSPLKRWLQKQVNRPWDKVYAEICQHIDRRNTVQEHIFAHIDQFVERDVCLIDGRVYVQSNAWQRSRPIEETYAVLYVHPETGILRAVNKVSAAKRYQARRRQEEAALAAQRRVIDAFTQLHFVDGIWYEVKLAMLPSLDREPDPRALHLARAERDRRRDVLHNVSWVRHGTAKARDEERMRDEWYGNRHLYAVSKRQLSTAELRQYKLENTKHNAPVTTGAFFVQRLCVLHLWRAHSHLRALSEERCFCVTILPARSRRVRPRRLRAS